MDKKIFGIKKARALIIPISFLLLIGCREKVYYTMSKDGSFSKDVYYLGKTKGDNIKIVNAVIDSNYFLFHIIPSNPYYYNSSFGYIFLKYIGFRSYKVNGKDYKIEGYQSIWPIIMDGHEGLFYNQELGVVHLVNFDWNNYIYLSKRDNIDAKSLELLNNMIMSDTDFYYHHWLPMLE